MFNTYAEAANYVKSAKQSTSRLHRYKPAYIMTKDGQYIVAWGNEDKEYGESVGFTVVNQ